MTCSLPRKEQKIDIPLLFHWLSAYAAFRGFGAGVGVGTNPTQPTNQPSKQTLEMLAKFGAEDTWVFVPSMPERLE